MELPRTEQLSRLVTFGGFNKGQLYGDVVALEEWSVLKRGTPGANEVCVCVRVCVCV
jgi:hypothetical protein